MAGTKIEGALNKVADAVKEQTSMADTIAASSDRVAEAATKSVEAGTMGIKGVVLNNVGNMAAMAVIAGAFIYLGQFYLKQTEKNFDRMNEELKQARIDYMSELKTNRLDQDARREKTEATHTKAMEKMGTTVERAVNSMEDAVKEMKEVTRTVGRVTGSKGPP